MKTILFILSFFTFDIYAQNQVYLQACFNSSALARSAYKEVNFIKNQNDKIKYNNLCLDFYIDTIREELYTKFLQIKFNGQYQLSSTSIQSEKQCQLDITKIEDQNSLQDQIQISKQGNLARVNDSKIIETKMSLIISDGLTGSLQLDTLNLNILCKVKPDGLSLDLSYQSSSESITTSRYVNFGQTIDIADFVQNIQNKNNDLSLNKGINIKKVQAKKFISVKLRAKQ